MRRYLLVALWPAGMAAIAIATVRAARRAPRVLTPPAAADAASHAVTVTEDGQAGGTSVVGPVIDPAVEAGSMRQASSAPAGPQPVPEQRSRRGSPIVQRGDLAYDLIRLGAISCAGGVMSYQVMAFIGPPIVNHGLVIDKPIHDWINGNQVKTWAAVMNRFNKVGNTWTTWGAAGTAAACLGVTYPKQKWLPGSVLGAAVLVDHYATLALRHKFHRLGPPTSPLGTYPSGGCDRVILFYGLIGYLLWREFSGSHRGKVWSVGTVAALSFIETYCRAYLSRHWFTDIVSGTFYGGVLLLPFVAAVRLIAGPAKKMEPFSPV
jgi:hypothetical protein